MGIILDFLFGKSPKIFNKDNEVEHKHPTNKWEDWNKKYYSNPEYNWKNHTGTKATSKKSISK